MSLKKGSKIGRGYATVAADNGTNYRDIADVMTKSGTQMNHSSARNHVLRSMKKIVLSYAKNMSIDLSPDTIDEIARNPMLHDAIVDIAYTGVSK